MLGGKVNNEGLAVARPRRVAALDESSNSNALAPPEDPKQPSPLEPKQRLLWNSSNVEETGGRIRELECDTEDLKKALIDARRESALLQESRLGLLQELRSMRSEKDATTP